MSRKHRPQKSRRVQPADWVALATILIGLVEAIVERWA
jgi:hypothetical protein